MPEPATAPRPWGLWPTLAISVAVLGAYFLLHLLVFAVLESTPWKPGVPGIDREYFPATGMLYTIATFISAPLCVLLIFLFARLRKDFRPGTYLGFCRITAGRLLRWLLYTLPVIVAIEVLLLLTSRPVQEFMLDLYRTAPSLPSLFLALVLFTPLFEETLFRGFLFRGIRHSRLGAAGAVILSAVLWTALHTQYDLPGTASIFFLGIFLGIARERTGSLYVPLAIHSMINIIALAETYAYAEYLW